VLLNGLLNPDNATVREMLSPSAKELRRANVLLIDDNEVDRTLCLRAFLKQKFPGEVICAGSYDEVARCLHDHSFDVIVCDYQLTGWTGLDVLRLVREAGQDTPFILLTGYLDDESAAECVRRGMASCVFKDHLQQLPGLVLRAFEERLVREEQRRAELALHSAEARARAMLESALDAILISDSEGRIVDFNPAAERTFGYSRHEVLGKPLAEIVVPPHLRPAHVAGWKRFLQVGAGRIINRRLEMRSVRRDGTEFDVELTVNTFSHEGQTMFVGFMRDITQHKAAQEALARSEALHRQIVTTMTEGIWMVDANFVTTFVNQRMAALLGYEPDEMLGRPITNFAFPEDHPEVATRMAERRAGVSAQYDSRWRHRTGIEVWMLTSASPLKDESGAFTGALGMLTDITERRRIEKEREAAEQRFRSLVEQSLVGIYVVQDGRFTYVNPKMADIFGAEANRMVGRPVLDFVALEHRQLVEDNLRIRFSGAMESIRYNVRMIRADGARIEVEVHGTRAEYNGRPAIIGALLDVTEQVHAQQALQESEIRFRQIVESNLLGICFWDRERRILEANEVFRQMIHFSADELLEGTVRWQTITPSEHRKAHERMFSELGAKGTCEVFESELYRRDGTRFPVLLGAARLEGNTAGVAFVLDVTRQKQLEAQFLQAQKMETVGRLASGVAHDFNNLLTAIGSFAQLAHDEVPENSTARSDLEQVLNATKRAAALTGKLLAFARQQVVHPVILNPATVLTEMQKMLSRLVRENIEFSIAAPETGCLRADPTQLEQVIVNLVVNAIDAMPQGGKLVVGTRDVKLTEPLKTSGGTVPPGHYVSLAVQDSGCGMTEDVLEHLFEPFFTTKPLGKGTGLGLAMVYGMVTQAQGFITVKSEAGAGTTFEILFPRVVANESPKPAAPVRPGLGRGTESILLVEDQEDVRRAVTKMLQSYGYSVIAASNAEEALQILNVPEQRVDVLVTDVVLPGMDGKQLAAVVAEKRPATKVLLVSGYNEVVTEADLADSTFLYLSKPFTAETLSNKIREIMAQATVPR
jgi:two-component system, cell cycle sensor histidine kinase and response regulator CckA